MSILAGLILVALGGLLVLKTEWLVTNFGRVAWAEEHLGSDGGTRIFYKLLGTAIILLGFATLTGVFQPILFAVLSPLFGGLSR